MYSRNRGVKEMDNQDRVNVATISTGKMVDLNFDKKEGVTILYSLDDTKIRMSKELAEEYLAQLSKTLEDLDRSS